MEDGGIWSEERKGLAPSTNAFLFPNHWKPSRYRVTGADGSEREKVRGDSVFADGSGVYMSSETELASMPAYIEKAQTVWEVIYCKFFIVQCFQCFVVCLVCNFGFTYALLSNWGTIYPPYNMYMWTWISPNVSSTTCIGSDVPGTAFIVSFCCTLLSGNNSRRAMLGAPLWPPHKVPGKALPQCGNMLGTVQPLDSRVLARGCWRFFPALRCRWLLGRVLINSLQFTVLWGGGLLLIMTAIYFAASYPDELMMSTLAYCTFRAVHASLLGVFVFTIVHLAEVSADNCDALVKIEAQLKARSSGDNGFTLSPSVDLRRGGYGGIE